MGNATNLCAVHRFRDELALTACDHEEGATIYLSLAQARKIRAAMGRIIRDIEKSEFAKGQSGLGLSVDTRDKRYSHGERIDRP